MVFLAIGQWIFGPTIDRYLLFQIIVLALIPPLLFLLGKRMMGYAGGLFLAALAIIQEISSINLYEQIGSVNVKLENSELLTAFLLIILCLVLFNWYKSPGQKKWAIFSGGLLGLSILVRFNSILIAPLILIIFWIANRKNKKIIVTGLCLFVLSFSLASMPGFLTERTATGNNFFIAKAQGILNSLNKTDTLSQNPKPTATPKATSTPVKPGSNATPKPNISISSKQSSNGLTYTPSTTNRGGSAGIFYHFLNNNYSSLAKLPTELFFEPISVQVDENIWNFKVAEPIWKENLSFQNVIALLLSLMLVTLGIFTAGKKFGLAGLSPLVIQLGYYLGNAAAATSGGRYLEPVIWVTLIYFVLGIYTLTSLLVSLVRKDFQIKDIQSVNQPAAAPAPKYHENRKIVFLLIGFLFLGLLVPLSNSLPNRMPEQGGKQTRQTAYLLLSKNSSITAAQWQSFLSDPKSAVVEGIAYDARYYRSKFFLPGTSTFEMMVLGKQTVIVSYMVDVIPTTYFSDGSDVILVGCLIANDTMWYAKRTIMQTYAVFQVDHEKNSYIYGSSLPECSK
jgi:4-amino-4-deoxy-L-arabinose transferase-like glycosyltransferase